MSQRWVALDVGETLIDETRIWSVWADELGIPRLTFMAALGAVIARGGEHREVFSIFEVDDWPMRLAAIETIYGGFTADDLYPDALRAIARLRDGGYRIAVVANQPAVRSAELRAAGVEADVMVMSEELGVAKPDPAFYARIAQLTGAAPSDIAYVGDRVDNDMLPSVAAGMRAIWIRRGPWGVIGTLPPGTPVMVVATLDEVADRIGQAWD
ncbi:MAG: HAD family hydrolase [Chloroflexota bacterium]